MSNAASSPFDKGDKFQDQVGGVRSWRGLSIINSPRAQDIDRKLQYFECTQHDGKIFDFNGHHLSRDPQRQGQLQSTQPALSQAAVPFYVPLRERRPSTPYRLARAIDVAFTSMLFGEGGFPHLQVLGDLKTEDYAGALSEAADLPQKMVMARNYGGASGTAAASWAFRDGRFRVRVHNPKTLFVHKWDDRDELVVRHATQAYLYPKDVWNPYRNRWERAFFWYRRDWTPDADMVFQPLRFVNGVDPTPYWEVDPDKSVMHGDGLCHLVWAQNLPSDDVDGDSDYEGQWENFDSLDIMCSVVFRGATLNLDPTLVLVEDRMLIERLGVRKGSDNAIVVSKDGGDAKYLELAGTSIEAGIKIINEHRRAILDSSDCVIPDPDKVAAAALSSVAIKAIYRPMLSKAEVLRGQYKPMISRLLEGPLVVVRQRMGKSVFVYDDQGNQVFEDDGSAAEAEVEPPKLPPKVEQVAEEGDDGEPTGELKTKITPRDDPGEGEEVRPRWPEFFPPTPQDVTAMTTAMTTAAGQGKAVLSQQTATEYIAQAMGKDPQEEWHRVQQQQSQDDQKQQEQMEAMGGAVGGKGDLPPGAKPKPGKPGKPGAPGAPPDPSDPAGDELDKA